VGSSTSHDRLEETMRRNNTHTATTKFGIGTLFLLLAAVALCPPAWAAEFEPILRAL
jgi:hypothetical protein